MPHFKITALLLLSLYSIGSIIATNLAYGEDPTQSEWKTTNVKIINKYATFPFDSGLTISYKITSGEVENILVESELEPPNVLMIYVNSTTPGQLVIKLPRDIIDSRQDSVVDSKFHVSTGMVHDPPPGPKQDAEFQEVEQTLYYRTLSINFPVQTPYLTVISIQGTHAIPEFNGLEFVALAVAMTTTLVTTSKFRGKFRF